MCQTGFKTLQSVESHKECYNSEKQFNSLKNELIFSTLREEQFKSYVVMMIRCNCD